MLVGLSFQETMSGSYWRLDAAADERALGVTIDARARDLRGFARDKTWTISGTIDAEGMASSQALEGTIAWLVGERRVPYRFRFMGDDGRAYELSGQKEWSGLSPLESMTLLPASLYDSVGQEIGRATLRFDLRADLGRWMKTFRLHFFE